MSDPRVCPHGFAVCPDIHCRSLPEYPNVSYFPAQDHPTDGGFDVVSKREYDKLIAVASNIISENEALLSEKERRDQAISEHVEARAALTQQILALEHHIGQMRYALERCADLASTPQRKITDTIYRVASAGLVGEFCQVLAVGEKCDGRWASVATWRDEVSSVLWSCRCGATHPDNCITETAKA